MSSRVKITAKKWASLFIPKCRTKYLLTCFKACSFFQVSSRPVVTSNRVKLLFGGVILSCFVSLTACQQGEQRSSNDDSKELTVQPSLPSNNQDIPATPQKKPNKITVNVPTSSPTPSLTAKPQITPSPSPSSVATVPRNPSTPPAVQSSPKSNNSISKALTEKLSPPKPASPTTSPKPVVEALKTAAKSPARRIAAASNINVYRSRRLGVNFKYPKGFVIKEPQKTSSSSNKVLELWSLKDYQAIESGKYKNTFSPGNMSISLENNPQGLSLVEWVTNNDELGDVVVESFDTHIVAGKEAVSFRTDGLYEFQNLVLPSSDDKNVILISLAKGDRNYHKVFEQVVSSLQVN